MSCAHLVWASIGLVMKTVLVIWYWGQPYKISDWKKEREKRVENVEMTYGQKQEKRARKEIKRESFPARPLARCYGTKTLLLKKKKEYWNPALPTRDTQISTTSAPFILFFFPLFFTSHTVKRSERERKAEKSCQHARHACTTITSYRSRYWQTDKGHVIT